MNQEQRGCMTMWQQYRNRKGKNIVDWFETQLETWQIKRFKYFIRIILLFVYFFQISIIIYLLYVLLILSFGFILKAQWPLGCM